MTNSIVLLILIQTNWLSTSDWKREDGTNYQRKQQVIYTNTWVVETRLCITSNLIRQAQSTNGPKVWEAVGTMALPPLPGAMNKQ